MKKIMAVMLILCMALTILPMGISVGATETETETGTSSTPTLIFDMDLSGCTAESITVTDSSNSGKTGTIYYGVAASGKTPTYGVTAQGTKYLNFKTAADASETNVGNRAVNVPLTGTAGQAVYDANELSVSAWVYSDCSYNDTIYKNNGFLFSFGQMDLTTDYGYSFRHSNNNNIHMSTRLEAAAVSGVDSFGNSEKYLEDTSKGNKKNYMWETTNSDAWKYVTITREWTKTADATETIGETGYYTVNFYIDGVWRGSYTNSDAPKVRQTYASKFDTNKDVKLAIGNFAGSGGNAYGGKIADFKLYTGILTTEQMLADYAATYDDFYGEVSGGETPEDPDDPDDPQDPVTPPATTSSLVFDMDLSGCNATTIAVADSSGSNKTGTIAYGVANNGKKPSYGVTEQGTPYLAFNAAGEEDAGARAVNIPITDKTVYDANAMTISAWVYSDNVSNNSYFFSFGEVGDNGQWAYSLKNENNVMLKTMFDADGSGIPETTYSIANPALTNAEYVWPATNNNKWQHVTLTRIWTQTAAATETTGETGYYTVNLYINGEWAGSCSETAAVRQTYADAFADADGNTGDVKLAIGNCAGGSGLGYGGKIADFKLYTEALSTEAIAADYEATYDDFYGEVGGDDPVIDSTLVFDMDLSDCSLSTIAVKDESGNNKVKGYSYGAGGNGQKPAYAVTEQGTPYLIFDDGATSGPTKTVNVLFKDTSVHDADEMTITAWVKETNMANRDGKYLFGFGPLTGSAFGYGIQYYSNQMRSRLESAALTGVSSLGNNPYSLGAGNWPSAYTNQWKHVTFTKKWTTTDSASNTGYYEVIAYVDGVQVGRYTNQSSPKVRQKYSDAFPTATYSNIALGIGGMATGSGDQSFAGAVADFKVYTEILSTDAINADYHTTKSGYYDITPSWKSVTFTNESDVEITESNGLLAEATEVTAVAEVSDFDGDGKVILGLYDESGNLIAVNMADLGEQNASSAISAATVTAAGSGINRAVVYLWESTTDIAPILPAKAIGAEPAPLKVSAQFKDGDNSAITYMDGADGIKATLALTAGEPSDSIIATLKLMRGTTVLYSNSSDAAVFANGSASLEVEYEANEAYETLPTAQEGDELLLVVTDAGKTVFEKRLPFADQSKIVDVILVAGQSNAVGQGGNRDISMKPAQDTVYYNTMGSKHLSTYGNTGWDSALGKTWHEETGRTVLIVKAAWGGTGFPKKVEIDTGTEYPTGSTTYGFWNPVNDGSKVEDPATKPYDCYTLAKNKYEAAIASIDTDEYTIGRQVYFWNQGENENGSYTAAEYEAAFMELHNEFKEWGLQYGGILPVRSSLLAATASTDSAEASLKLTGPRIAQYKMGETQSNIFVVADVMERWSSDANIEEWFADKYAGEIFYGGQQLIPKNWDGIMYDHVHYNQYALNELGIDAARGMLAHLRGQGTADGIDIITPNGIEHIENGGTITLPAKDGDSKNCTINGVIPVMPVASGLEGTFTLSGNTAAELTADGVLVPKTAIAGDFSTLTVTYTEGGAEKSMSFKVESALVDDSVEIEIASVYNNYPAIYTLLTDDGYYYTHDWLNTELVRIETAKGLEANSLKATMGLVPDWMGGATKTGVMTWEQAQTLASNGRWGVANHTKSHNQGEFTSLTAEELSEEINGGRAALLEKFPGHKIVGLLTPGGASSEIIRKTAAEEHFALRRTGASYNLLPLTQKTVFKKGESESRSLYTLTAAQMVSGTTSAIANGYVDGAISNGGWVIGMWHGVGADANAWSPVPQDVATAHLEYVADKAKAGQLWVTTYDEASVYAKQRVNTRLSLKETTDTTIVFALEDDLGVNALYDATLTVNVTLPGGWATASATIGGETIPSTVDGGVLTMNIKARNAGNITIAKGE